MEVEAPSGMTADILAKFQETSGKLSKGRKKRQPPAGQASAEALASYSEVASESVLAAGLACVDVHQSEPLAAVGGSDGSVALFDCEKKSKTVTLSGHTKRVTGVRLHPVKPLLLTSSADATARLWSTDGSCLHTLSGHTGQVTGVTLHATGDFCVTSSMDKSWALHDLERGAMVFKVGDGAAGYTCAGFHPDGLILGTGAESVVRIWDVKSQANVASFEGHAGVVSCLAFSENGYYLATGSADATVKIWDLRKLKNINSIAEEGAGPITSLAFDFSGGFLAVGGAGVNVYESKGWTSLKSFPGSSVTGVGFGKAASAIAATTSEGVIKLYS